MRGHAATRQVLSEFRRLRVVSIPEYKFVARVINFPQLRLPWAIALGMVDDEETFAFKCCEQHSVTGIVAFEGGFFLDPRAFDAS